MKLIRKLGRRDKTTWWAFYGEFRCDYCKKMAIKQLSHGRRQKSCGCLLEKTHILRKKGSRYMGSMRKTNLNYGPDGKKRGAFTLYLGKSYISKLILIADYEETSVSALVRQAIKAYIRKKDKELEKK